MKYYSLILFGILAIFLVATFFVPNGNKNICYWEISSRGLEERHALNWIFEPPNYSKNPNAAVEMAKYASLMGYDYIGTTEYNEECGVGCHGYWASNTMYGVIDWVPDDPRIVCLRANQNSEFPCFISWRMGYDGNPDNLSNEEQLRYFNGEILSYWIDVQRDYVINMYLSALESQPCYDMQWDQIEIIYFDEFSSTGYSYINEDYELIQDDYDMQLRCHECHEGSGLDGLGHEYDTVEEGRLVMEARMIELAHEHGVKVIASATREWFDVYLPFILGERPESEWTNDIPLERYRAAVPDYFVIEPDLGDPGTQEFEWSLPDYTSAEPYAQRVYAGSPRPGDADIGIDSDKNIYTVEQVLFRSGYLASRGFWFGPNSESMDAIQYDPELQMNTAVKPFLKAIPNWENLNDVPLEQRTFDTETLAYDSTKTHIGKDAIYSVHPFTGDYHVIFLDKDAACKLEGEWDDYNVYSTTAIWEREQEAKGDLEYINGMISLADGPYTNTGYIITKNEYMTLEEMEDQDMVSRAVGLIRMFIILGIFLIILINVNNRRKKSNEP